MRARRCRNLAERERQPRAENNEGKRKAGAENGQKQTRRREPSNDADSSDGKQETRSAGDSGAVIKDHPAENVAKEFVHNAEPAERQLDEEQETGNTNAPGSGCAARGRYQGGPTLTTPAPGRFWQKLPGADYDKSVANQGAATSESSA